MYETMEYDKMGYKKRCLWTGPKAVPELAILHWGGHTYGVGTDGLKVTKFWCGQGPDCKFTIFTVGITKKRYRTMFNSYVASTTRKRFLSLIGTLFASGTYFVLVRTTW